MSLSPATLTQQCWYRFSYIKFKSSAFISPLQEEELAGVKSEALGLMKEVETCKVERADAVNQLTRSLEESQRQCRDLLDTGEGSLYQIQILFVT